MKIIFQIEGGIGKSIAATAVCKAIRTQYPDDDLIVISAYPEVFLCNPCITKVYDFNHLNYFYQDHIEGQEVKAMLHNPYFESNFLMEEGHLIKVWCEMFGIKYNGELPDIYLNNREQTFFSSQFVTDKPIMLIQTNGGPANQTNKYSWTRDIPHDTAQLIVNHFCRDYNVVHIRREDQPGLENTTAVQAEFRAIATLILHSKKRLFMDSFAQHTSAALNKPAVVCWIGNSPKQFGYDMHTNIIANPPTIKPELKFSIFNKYNISGQITEFPYNNEHEIFNVEDIIRALEEQPEHISELVRYAENV